MEFTTYMQGRWVWIRCHVQSPKLFLAALMGYLAGSEMHPEGLEFHCRISGTLPILTWRI
jgi:hypothetical protein